MNNLQRPLARQKGLVIQEMPDEILVFDTETNKAHCLNETAAFVWKACDGKNSVADITKLFGNQSSSPVQEDLIWLAIDQLSNNNLLAEELQANFNGQSRREVIKKIGLAAVVSLPIITSIIAPPAAAGATGDATGNNVCSGTSTQGFSCSKNVVCNESGGTAADVGRCDGMVCVGCKKTSPIIFGTPHPRS